MKFKPLSRPFILALTTTFILFYFLTNSASPDIPLPVEKPRTSSAKTTSQHSQFQLPSFNDDNLPFMPKMQNETLKAALGNSAWHLLHTILARYPDEPTENERSHLTNYIYSFAHVYPCGDCARHFIKLLEKYPPQVNSRKNAALWGCMIHNKVNDRLGKPNYDCKTILEDYDCGCGSDEKASDDTLIGNTLIDAELEEHLSTIKLESEEFDIGG
ncbi:flavin-linked sulfhydryl oxidase [Martiniozyma asiatica (nom. inval.)]|nr:flavin-linked sulfhydryl oxidase [Martiniozyma asiatica]